MFGTHDCGFRTPEDVDEAADFGIKDAAQREGK